MKVLIIPSWYPTEDNPISGIFFKEQAEALNEYIDVAVLNLNRMTLRNPKNIFIKKRKDLKYRNDLLTLNKDYIDWFPKISFLKTKIYKHQLLKSYNRIIKEFGKPDIIHAHVSYPAGYGAMLLSEELEIPFIVTEHATFFSEILMGRHKKFTKKVLDKAESYVAVSSPLKNKIIEAGRSNCEVIPNFIDFEKFSKSNEPEIMNNDDKFNLINVSLMTEKKGIIFLLKSLKQLVENFNYKNIHLNLVGDGPKKNEYKKIAKKLNIMDFCTFYGMVENDKVANLMNKSKALVISSKKETFGVVGIEAMAAGLPVVATICGGPEDYVTSETGLLVERENVNDLSKGIKNLIDNYQSYDSEVIKKYIKDNFSKEAVTKEYIKLYQKIIS
jgi:glycosyltransferase involved in cell wall biosynthesis